MGNAVKLNADGKLEETTISAGGGSSMTVSAVSVNTSLSVNTMYLCSNQITLTLPNASNNDRISIKNIDNYTKTITPYGSHTIDRDTSLIIQYQDSACDLVFYNNNWSIV